VKFLQRRSGQNQFPQSVMQLQPFGGVVVNVIHFYISALIDLNTFFELQKLEADSTE
jgi:hypothetical protein